MSEWQQQELEQMPAPARQGELGEILNGQTVIREHPSLGLGRDYQAVMRVGETVMEASLEATGSVVVVRAYREFDGMLLAGVIGDIGGLRYLNVLDDGSLLMRFAVEEGRFREVEQLVEVLGA